MVTVPRPPPPSHSCPFPPQTAPAKVLLLHLLTLDCCAGAVRISPGQGGGKRGSSHTKRGGKHASLENSNAAMINNTSIVGASVGAGLLVVAAALFAIKKRSARASPIAESETLLE